MTVWVSEQHTGLPTAIRNSDEVSPAALTWTTGTEYQLRVARADRGSTTCPEAIRTVEHLDGEGPVISALSGDVPCILPGAAAGVRRDSTVLL